jgi:ArsR family transcriptional regulator
MTIPVMTNAVTFSRALADPTRWRIVRLVMHDALCVCELADILEMPQSSVSSHVQIIRKAGLLESEKREKWTYFRIEARFLKLLGAMETLFKDTGEIHWEADAGKAASRLQHREGSCCPGPRKLISRSRSRQRSATPTTTAATK